ncbi:hypothetical protein SAMN05216353_13939 [Halobacillus alkaliphilus]|uniref:Sublancin immunity protein SunI-like PH domain-containing protein n=1 Tax=Halobacillus alkaliphilus TaxID=396056 RepID=A0A1I2RN09_9BACI|nr:hypothetical protein [Halobacillus alkaliphilus]SFG39211.1 hypothetical protein SAMN05216353_13939 [Halobacillus alkaliphilus]
MFGISVKEKNGNVIVSWQLSRVEIPKNDIIDVTDDDTYGGEEQTAIRIGYPNATTERIFIRTNKQNYILFTNNVSIKEKIESLINR